MFVVCMDGHYILSCKLNIGGFNMAIWCLISKLPNICIAKNYSAGISCICHDMHSYPFTASFPSAHIHAVLPNCTNLYGNIHTVTIVSADIEKCKRSDSQVAHTTTPTNFWHSLCENFQGIKLCLSSAVVKASLLLRCGDVEKNPGPNGGK